MVKMYSIRIYIIFILLFNVQVTFSGSHMKTVNIECFPSSKYFYNNHSCYLKAINRYKAVGMMSVQARNYLRNLSVNIGLYIRNDANIFKPFLVNITQNICQWLDRKSQGAYIGIFMKTLSKYTNVNHSCPYTGVIFAKNIYLDTKLIPVQMPKNSYKFKFLFYEGYPLDYIGTVSYYMDLIETRN